MYDCMCIPIHSNRRILFRMWYSTTIVPRTRLQRQTATNEMDTFKEMLLEVTQIPKIQLSLLATLQNRTTLNPEIGVKKQSTVTRISMVRSTCDSQHSGFQTGNQLGDRTSCDTNMTRPSNRTSAFCSFQL